MKRTSSILLLIFLVGGLPPAVSAQVLFSEVNSLEEMEQARQDAAERQIPLFVDVYASWCGPCKMMDSQVYADPEVSAYMNEQFVNVRLDGETEYGRKFAADNELQGYPSMFVFSPDGEMISRIIGFTEADRLTASLGNTVENYSLVKKYRPRYEAGKLNDREFAQYIDATRKMGLREQADSLASEYMKTMKGRKLSDADIQVIAYYLTTDDPRWQQFSEDTDRLRRVLGEDYMLAIEKTYNNTLVKAVEQENIGLISSLANEIPPMVRDEETSSWDLRSLPYLQYYYYTDRVEELINYVDERFASDKRNDHRWLYGAAAQIIDMDRQYRTPKLLEKAVGWFQACINLQEKFDYYFYKGMTLFLLQKDKEAKASFNKAETLVSNDEQRDLINQVMGFVNRQ
jgi:thiol-disulfide isomerase/thioredoxin